MRRQVLLLIAVASFYISETAQQRHFIPKISLVRTYDVANLNKSFGYTTSISKEKLKTRTKLTQAPLLPHLKLKRVLYQQLGDDLSFLNWENWEKWQLKLGPGCGTYPISFDFRD